jgi:polyhydroxybutyrate depolymerase
MDRLLSISRHGDLRSSTAVLLLALTAALAPQPVLAEPAAPSRLSAGCARGAIERGDRLERSLDVGGMTRDYVLDAPAALEPGHPVPLLLDFHGLGHSGAGVWKVSGFRALARRDPFLTAYPEGLPVRLETPARVFEGTGWEIRMIDGNRDLAFVRALLDRIESEYCVDRARVYATGFSNGAFLSQLLACTMPERIAAVAPVSGGTLAVPCEPTRAVPMMIHHGRQDERIDVAQARRVRDAWLRIDGCATPTAAASNAEPEPASADPGAPRVGGEDGIRCIAARACRDGAVVEYCEGDFAHRWPPSATARIWEFLLAHPMPASPGG